MAMDLNATLVEMLNALAAGEAGAAAVYADHLSSWLKRGGVAPEVELILDTPTTAVDGSRTTIYAIGKGVRRR